MIIEGNIETHGKVQNEGKKPYNSIQVSGKKYNHFNDEWLQEFQVGTIVKLDVTQNGQYWNINTMGVGSNTPQVASTSTVEPNTSFVITRNERANSYEVGKAGERFKIYFGDANDLLVQIGNLEEAGLFNNTNNLTVSPADFGKNDQPMLDNQSDE